MNSVILIGRLTRDVELRYTDGTQMAVANFNLAVDRGKDKNGNDKGADFPRITVFGKQAENCEKYLHKGSLCAVQGRIQTNNYQDQEGKTVYSTGVIADRIRFLDPVYKNQGDKPDNEQQGLEVDGYKVIDDDMPF